MPFHFEIRGLVDLKFSRKGALRWITDQMPGTQYLVVPSSECHETGQAPRVISKLMIPFNPAAQYVLPSTILFILGLVDLLRGVLHTFFINWAVRTFAKLDLSIARHDQLTLLGAFGISNLLTGVIFILVSIEAAPLSEYLLLTIPCAYTVGAIGMRTSGVKAQSAFYGRYFMMGYLGLCLVTFVLSQLRP